LIASMEASQMRASGASAPSLTDVAYDRLKRKIVHCELAPGDRVTERQLSQSLDVGLTPVREALARLNQEGLVRTLPRRGYVITPLTPSAVDELFQAFRVIGTACAELAATRATDDDVERLRRLVERGRPARVTLAAMSGNSRLAELFQRLDSELERVFTMLFLHGRRRVREGLELDPEVVLAAVSDNDAEALKRHVGDVVDRARADVAGEMERWPEPPGVGPVAVMSRR
jgi:DNA-binding GntR family transcriptional regulator